VKTLKSIGAIIAGLALGAVLSICTDLVMEKSGLMIRDPFNNNSTVTIAFIVFYRTCFNVLGCFVAGKLAPSRPLRHAMIIGWIGLLLTIAGAIAMWHVPPHWYPISLILLTLPSAWSGGKLAEKN
jgi:hypothetical protein